MVSKKTSSTKRKWTADEVVELIRKRYAKDLNRYVVCEQVSPATGFNYRNTTWIDAMVISCWPSDGLHRESFEVKVSRADFLSEINNPSKNAWFKEHSTRFWYVTAPGVVASADEIPDGCGWMVAQEGSIVRKKQAPTKQNIAVTAEFMASISRAMVRETKRQVDAYSRDIIERDPVLKLAVETQEIVTQWLKERMPSKDRVEFHTIDQLKKLLDEATSGKEDQTLYEHVDTSLHEFRDTVARMLVDLMPYASTLLHSAEGVGAHMHRYGSRASEFDLLRDLRAEKGWEDKKWVKARKAKIRELELLLNEGKDNAREESTQDGAEPSDHLLDVQDADR